MDLINVTCSRGDTARFILSVVLADEYVDLTGANVVMVARYSPADEVLFELQVGSGVTLRNQTTETGVADIKMRPNDTLQLPNQEVKLFYTVHVILANGDEYCIVYGTMTVTPIAWDGTP